MNKDLLQSAFGELLVAEPLPMIQIDAIYGLRGKTDTESYVDSGSLGAIAVQENSDGTKEFRASSGTGAASFANLRSKRLVRYRAGQAIRMKFTARFSAGVALNNQKVGAFNFGNELAFGFNGATFGLLYRHGGLPGIRTLTVSVGAGGAETATITLNGVAKNVTLSAGTTVHASGQIAATSFPGWEVSSNDSVVTFVAKNDTVFSGVFTMSSTGTAAGTFATTKAGVTSTSTWVPQTAWNVDKCDGEGPSGFLLNPLRGNVYTVYLQYLGYGPLTYEIEDESGKRILVHRILYPNSYSTPSLSIPYFKAGIISENLGATTNVQVFCGSFVGFLDGVRNHSRVPDSQYFAKTSVGTSFVPILTVRNRSVFNSTWNLTSLLMHIASLSVDGGKNCTAQLVLNGVLTGDPNWTNQDVANSCVEYDTASTGISIGANSLVIRTINLAKVDSKDTDLASLDLILEANDYLTIAIKTDSTTTDAGASFTWIED